MVGNEQPSGEQAARGALSGWVYALAVGVWLLQMAPLFFHDYGYFIDELYYLACAARPQAGYVDHPPLAPLLLRANVAVFGESLFAVRWLPASLGAGLVYLTGWLARYFGGGRFAQVMASLGVATAPLFLIVSAIFSMNVLMLFIWTACLMIVLRMVESEDPRWWLLFGLVSGVGLETKHTIVLLAGACLVAIALLRKFHLLFTPWLLAGGLIAFVLFVPNLWWQLQNDWASLDFYRGQSVKNVPTSPLGVLFNQVLVMNPGAAPIWLAGLAAALFGWFKEPGRFIGLVYLMLLGSMILLALSRPDRIAGLYPAMFAVGAVSWERWTREKRWLRVPLVALAAVVGALLMPISIPVLPKAMAADYASSIGVVPQIEAGEGKRAALPQWIADKVGWRRFIEDVSQAVERLDAEERKTATILAPSYGHAGAIELWTRFGNQLPPVLAHHNTYHLWGFETVDRLTRGPLIMIGGDVERLNELYDTIELVKRHDCGYCMTWRNDLPIYLARDPKALDIDLEAAWEAGRHFE